MHYSEAWAELKEFSEALGIPVGETFVGEGAIRDESPLLLGGVGRDRQPGRRRRSRPRPTS